MNNIAEPEVLIAYPVNPPPINQRGWVSLDELNQATGWDWLKAALFFASLTLAFVCGLTLNMNVKIHL